MKLHPIGVLVRRIFQERKYKGPRLVRWGRDPV